MRWPKFLTRIVYVERTTFLDALHAKAPADYTGVPSFACMCGCAVVLVPVVFDEDEREIANYWTTGYCTDCGAAYTVPTADPREVEQWEFL